MRWYCASASWACLWLLAVCGLGEAFVAGSGSSSVSAKGFRGAAVSSRAPFSPSPRATPSAEEGAGAPGDDMVRAKIVVRGMAYGGYFRAHARNEAHFNRKLCGALQEFEDRTEIVVEGRRRAIESFVRWCRRGPGLSQRIEAVETSMSDYTGIFDSFEVLV